MGGHALYSSIPVHLGEKRGRRRGLKMVIFPPKVIHVLCACRGAFFSEGLLLTSRPSSLPGHLTSECETSPTSLGLRSPSSQPLPLLSLSFQRRPFWAHETGPATMEPARANQSPVRGQLWRRQRRRARRTAWRDLRPIAISPVRGPHDNREITKGTARPLPSLEPAAPLPAAGWTRPEALA